MEILMTPEEVRPSEGKVAQYRQSAKLVDRVAAVLMDTPWRRAALPRVRSSRRPRRFSAWSGKGASGMPRCEDRPGWLG